MRKPFLTSLLCLLMLNAFAQKFTVSNPSQNIVYAGISTRIEASVDNHNCKSVILRTKDGNLTKNEDCSYDLIVAKAGEVLIEVGVKKNGKVRVVGTYPFRVKDIPSPIARVANRKGGSVSKGVLGAQVGVSATLENLNICGKFLVSHFYIIVIRKNKVIFGHYNPSYKFDDTIHYFMEELQKDDKVIFADIHCIGPDKMERQLAAVELTIE